MMLFNYLTAVVCWGAGEGMKVEDVEVDPPKASEVRIKMIYASVCHSDVTLMTGYPVVINVYYFLFFTMLTIS